MGYSEQVTGPPRPRCGPVAPPRESEEAAVARLIQAGLNILTVEMVIFEWLGPREPA
ncbi:MAG: hypothetical protein JOY71_08585 [Acetobacteraceae bacterium]|nr:hypothetical protein [Acetobacteraceae bacterium]